jgi:hypothetical protein
MTVRRVGSRKWNRVLRGEVPLARVLKVADEVREELLWEASKRLEAGELNSAEYLFHLCIILWRVRPDGHLGVGVCRMKKDQIADAIEYFLDSEEKDQSNPFILSNLAECSLLQGNTSAARDYLDRIDGLSDPRKDRMTDRLARLRLLVSTSEPPIV